MQKRQTQSQRKPRRGNRDCAEPEGLASSTQREAGVMQRAIESAQCLGGLTQRPGELTQCFSGAGEGFMEQIF